MQGRLTPPTGDRVQEFPTAGWAEEFEAASRARLSVIEWIYDLQGAGMNPIETNAGTSLLNDLAEKHGVRVRSVCADWFMEHPLAGSDQGGRRQWLDCLEWLLGRCRAARVRHIVLPFVDQAAIASDDDAGVVVEALRAAAPWAREAGVEIHVESSLTPGELRTLLERVAAPEVRINYDTGNSASLGYEPTQELGVYGDLIGSVHVKDRVRGGGTVPLGEGDADIAGVFADLRARAYAGDLILQVARGQSGEEVAWARYNRDLVQRLWESAD